MIIPVYYHLGCIGMKKHSVQIVPCSLPILSPIIWTINGIFVLLNLTSYSLPLDSNNKPGQQKSSRRAATLGRSACGWSWRFAYLSCLLRRASIWIAVLKQEFGNPRWPLKSNMCNDTYIYFSHKKWGGFRIVLLDRTGSYDREFSLAKSFNQLVS